MSTRSIGLLENAIVTAEPPSDYWTQCRERLRSFMEDESANGLATQRPFAVADETMELLRRARLLRFPTPVEQSFQDDYYHQSIGFARFAQVVGIFLYAVFGVLDYWGMPNSRSFAWMIRYGVVCPLMTLVLASSFLPVFRRLMQPALVAIMAAASLGVTAMIARASAAEPAYSQYYGGLVLIVIAAFTFLQLRLWYALLTAFITIVAYEPVAIFQQHLLRHPTGRSLLLNNQFLLLVGLYFGHHGLLFPGVLPSEGLRAPASRRVGTRRRA